MQVFYETQDVYVLACVYMCVWVAGTCLTLAIFITQSTEETWLKLMSGTTLRMLIIRGLPAAVSVLTKKLCEELPITSECQAQSQIKRYQSTARRKPRVFLQIRLLFSRCTTAQSSLFWTKPAGAGRAGPRLHVRRRNHHPKRFWQSSTLQLLAMGCDTGYGKVCWYNSSKQIHNLRRVWLKLWWHFGLVIGL